MSEAQPFTCPKCHKLVKNDDKSISEHYASPQHDKGLFEGPGTATVTPVNPYGPQSQQQPYGPPTPYYGPPQPGLPNQQWPHGNAPQLPPTRYLGWWDQVKGMWHYYRKGMVYWSLIMALATIAALTRL